MGHKGEYHLYLEFEDELHKLLVDCFDLGKSVRMVITLQIRLCCDMIGLYFYFHHVYMVRSVFKKICTAAIKKAGCYACV